MRLLQSRRSVAAMAAIVGIAALVCVAWWREGRVLGAPDLGTDGLKPAFATEYRSGYLIVHRERGAAGTPCDGNNLARIVVKEFDQIKTLREVCVAHDEAGIVMTDPARIPPWRTERLGKVNLREF